MSEHQFVHFLALDRPLDDEQLEYMRRQSSRAEISKWEFTNEYHYGDFRGNAQEMLQRGYDVHLHYANFGIRKLMFRLPMGLPCEPQTWKAFLPECGVDWYPDKKGRGGVLEIQPEADAGTYDYLDCDVQELAEIAPVRELLLQGDLRPLYVMWLVCNSDEEKLEPPVPAGLKSLPPCVLAMASFYEVGEDLLQAAAEVSLPLVEGGLSHDAQVKNWIQQRSKDELEELATQLLTGDVAKVRAETLARVRDESGAIAWPTSKPTRTLRDLHAAAEIIHQHRKQLKAQAKEKARRKHLEKLAADPQQAIAQAATLVKQRSTKNYDEAAKLLADLREALGPDRGPQQAESAAERLRSENPTLKSLVSAMRKQGLLLKKTL